MWLGFYESAIFDDLNTRTVFPLRRWGCWQFARIPAIFAKNKIKVLFLLKYRQIVLDHDVFSHIMKMVFLCTELLFLYELVYSYLSNKRTCPLILFKKKVQPTLWFSCNRLKIPPYPLVLRVGWIFYPTRLL